ncbi:hypothetical protein [Helicobacter sp. MIT 14-3879]|uniref:hypothetical protein n=1 Tax=Helicobacter sp. MIT 14-3879 TaxID=2040649 RepID=UPI000E1F8A82|nr:hypothetical protein [Helicobacter sp. MIT 14-3879]RDU59788.1 hypothetical protein CQA44_11120 [Helicobacter sp. MIT 14-3879]
MKTIIMSIFFIALGMNSIQAKAKNIETSTVRVNKTMTLSQSDITFLFDNIESNKFAVLDFEEMKETKGKFYPILLRFIGASLFANAPGLDDAIYNGTLLQFLSKQAISQHETDEIIHAYSQWIK